MTRPATPAGPGGGMEGAASGRRGATAGRDRRPRIAVRGELSSLRIAPVLPLSGGGAGAFFCDVGEAEALRRGPRIALRLSGVTTERMGVDP